MLLRVQKANGMPLGILTVALLDADYFRYIPTKQKARMLVCFGPGIGLDWGEISFMDLFQS